MGSACGGGFVDRVGVGLAKGNQGMGKTQIAFRVEGVPIPQGSKTVAKGGGKVWLRDSNGKKLKPWRESIEATVRELDAFFDVPIFVAAIFYLPRPKSVKRLLPSVKPDLDKLFRALGDGMTKGKLIKDDSLIVSKSVHKRYADGSNEPGVAVVVMEADDA